MQVVLLTTHENITGNGLRPIQKIIRRRKNEKKPLKNGDWNAFEEDKKY